MPALGSMAAIAAASVPPDLAGYLAGFCSYGVAVDQLLSPKPLLRFPEVDISLWAVSSYCFFGNRWPA